MRLIEFRQKDFEFIKYLTNNKKVYRYIRNGEIWSDEKISRFIKRRLQDQQLDISNRNTFYYIIQSNSKEELGVIGIEYKNKKYSMTIFIDPDHQGKGIFSNALKLLLRRIKRYKPFLKYVYAQVHTNNKKMNAILNKKGTYIKTYNIGDISVNEFTINLRK